jgi:hypothetical protein
MKCKYYGELKMHDGSVVPITDRRAAEKINAEFEWLFKKTSNDATTYTIRAVQCLFALKLGDRYGWTTDRLCQLLKDVAYEASLIQDQEIDIPGELEELRENYHIDLREDGMIRVEHYMDDNIYAPGEWRPISQRKPPRPGSYIITTDKGAVCQAHWHGEKFSGAAGAHAVAWKEKDEPWEFWKDEVEYDGRTDQHI